tara:strand:+ start:1724 stop:2944 length:1221 start_codon:yes stop_codon:yes gene_type:complete
MAIKDAIAALDSIGKQGATIWAADTAAKSAALTRQAEKDQWVATQKIDVYKTFYQDANTKLDDLNKEIAAGNFEIDDPESSQFAYWKDNFNARGEAFRNWAHAIGEPTYDSETDIIKLVDAIYAETIKTTDNPKKYLKFGDIKGKWGQFISRASPGVDIDLVKIVWDDRYSKLTDTEPYSMEEIPKTGKGWVAEIAGAPVDIITAGINLPADVIAGAEMWWKGTTDVEPRYQLEDPVGGREWLKGAFGDPRGSRYEGKSLNPFARSTDPQPGDKDATLSQYEEAAQRRDSANNLLSSIGNALISPSAASGPSAYDRTGRAGVIARQGAEQIDPLMGQQGLISGFLAQDTEEDELPEISRQAMRFLERLSAMIQEYGPEEAFKLMSGQFKDLSKSDRTKIEEYLENT